MVQSCLNMFVQSCSFSADSPIHRFTDSCLRRHDLCPLCPPALEEYRKWYRQVSRAISRPLREMTVVPHPWSFLGRCCRASFATSRNVLLIVLHWKVRKPSNGCSPLHVFWVLFMHYGLLVSELMRCGHHAPLQALWSSTSRSSGGLLSSIREDAAHSWVKTGFH